ncbi:MAG: hypothetical protein WAV09_03005 [Minisyncoccia bacterium]
MTTFQHVTIIFVFGSNLAGRHGKGAALWAKNEFGAVYGVGVGRTGNAYAIPTKSIYLNTLPLSEIAKHVRIFILYAQTHPELLFQVTRVGCGLAGYKNEEMAPLFKGCPANCMMPKEWLEFL